MSFEDYAGLKSSISSWLAKGTTYDDQIDGFIDLAEAEFNREFRLLDMEVEEELTTNAIQDYVEPGTDYHSIVSLKLASCRQVLNFTTKANIRDSYSADATGRPLEYAIGTEKKIILAPKPDGEYTLKAVLVEKIRGLSDDIDTNWLLVKSPDLYLFTALKYANLYLKNPAGAAEWEAKANQIKIAMKDEDADNRETRDVMAARSATRNP